jgi:hypothetical protein
MGSRSVARVRGVMEEGGGGKGAATEEDAPMRRSKSRRSRGTNRWGEKKNRRKGVNDKLAPHVRGDIGVRFSPLCPLSLSS